MVLPMYVTEGVPARVEGTFWLELPTDLVIYTYLGAEGDSPGGLGSGLLEAMQKPMVGPPRRPARIRVASEALAAEIRAAAGVPSDLSIVVAPTPELGAFVAQMSEHLATRPSDGKAAQSYLEDGRIPPDRIVAMFRAAAGLYGRAPWDLADDGQILLFDAPLLGVEGAVLAIIGALGESLGLVLFESMEAFRALLAEGERAVAEPAQTRRDIDLGSSVMALEFVDASELSPAMVKEVKKHRWTLPARGVYPLVTRRDRDGVPRPTSEADVRLATAAALAVSVLLEQHPDVFEEPPDSPFTVTSDDAEACGARLTFDPSIWAHEGADDDGGDDGDSDDDDDDAEFQRLLTFDGRPRLHVPQDSWRMRGPMDGPVKPSLVDDALEAMELAIKPKQRARKPQLESKALRRVHGALVSPAQRARAEALHRSVYEAAGAGGALVEAALLELIGAGSPPSSIAFWTETLRLTRSRDSFGPDRRRLALSALARMADGADATVVDQVVDVILSTLDSDSALTRADALDALTQLDQTRKPQVPAKAIAAIERVARSDRAFLPRFRARRILDWFGRAPVVDEGSYTFAIALRGHPDFRVSIEVAADQQLYDLQEALHGAINWDQDHLWCFCLGADSSPRRSDRIELGNNGDSNAADGLSLGQLGLVVGQKLDYLFDFGDCHRFDVKVTAHEPETNRRAKYPRVVDRKGRAPQQYRW